MILISFLSANAIHVWFDAHGNTEIRGMTRHLPLYQPATAVRFMAKQGWIDAHQVNQQASLKRNHSNSDLSYPKAPFLTNISEQPNIIFIAIDAWRADTFDRDTTPNTFQLTKDKNAQYFKDHHSGGNVTKGGIFSLFYALPPTYWDAFTAAQQAPVFFQTLQNAGYNTGIFGSGPLINPSFHRNVFSSIENLTTMTEGDTASQRDIQMVSNFQTFLDQNQQEPFVGFLFFDAAHGYAPPEDYEPKFTPYWDRVDHIKLGPDFDPVPYKNRYKTALHFVDSQIKNVIEDLKQRDLYNNSIIIITSDHGEEFNETKLNYWGHGSNFTPNQTQVPLLIIWPEKSAQTIEYRTSHYDIVPTLLQEAFKVTEPMESYSSGHSLFKEGGRDWLLVHSYFNYGVIMKDRIITTYPTGQYEVTDINLQPSELPMPAATTIEVLNEISQFYK
ncbi:sulfatase-like hydrolase/transferase [Marinomonas sp. 15G1-11]|uniref:Sulfatase-like hydrolase/transferase n=1 Tax=Marinomonas phaeophyticola TaxID=3004091 RepID=A0ABT4JZ68_9GAMM|nr:sulfatase-like hydrolase/transferase [Marinomonas sp. 15G1-11]MCZ2723525.1 sulfatase-like hydrolase/transferase [Marinomonas sp. 15G1-11]